MANPMRDTIDLVALHEKRLQALETYLPLLQEHFAGKIAGETDNQAMEKLSAASPNDAQKALDRSIPRHPFIDEIASQLDKRKVISLASEVPNYKR